MLILTISPVWAKRLHSESEYQAHWCNKHKGTMEYRLKDGARVDCLTAKYAVEFDFANKWHECIGQAIYYGRMTGKKPMCGLIVEDKKKDKVYINRLNETIYEAKRKGKIIKKTIIKPDDIIIKNKGD